MALNSSAMTDEVKWEIVRHFIYVIEGVCIAIFNALIVLTILRQHALRLMKEYTMLGALAFADCIAGLGTLMAGIHRLPLWLTGRETEPASGRYCLLTGHNLLWAWFDPASHAMLIAVSLDRLLSVLTPFKYNTLKNTYAFCVSGVAYGSTFVMSVVIFLINWNNVDPIHTKICWSSDAYGINGSHIRDVTNAITTLTSVIVYSFVPILYRSRVAPMNTANSDNFQKRLNKSISISCLFTFFFVGLPWLIHVWLLNNSKNLNEYESIAVWMFIVANVNPIVNLLIYYKKQIYFKKAFKALLRNKTLPLNLENWQTNTVAVRSVQSKGPRSRRRNGSKQPVQ